MDAGFPQIGKSSSIGSPDKLVWRISDRVYVPTLEELIDACGENFGSLDKRHDGWLARANGDQRCFAKPLPKPSPAYGSPYKNYDRHGGANIKPESVRPSSRRW